MLQGKKLNRGRRIRSDRGEGRVLHESSATSNRNLLQDKLVRIRIRWFHGQISLHLKSEVLGCLRWVMMGTNSYLLNVQVLELNDRIKAMEKRPRETVAWRTHAHVGLAGKITGHSWVLWLPHAKVLSNEQNLISESRKMSWNTFLIAKLWNNSNFS